MGDNENHKFLMYVYGRSSGVNLVWVDEGHGGREQLCGGGRGLGRLAPDLRLPVHIEPPRRHWAAHVPGSCGGPACLGHRSRPCWRPATRRPPDLRQEGLGDGNRAVNGGAVTQLLGEIEQWGVSIRLGRAGGRATQRRRSALLAHELVETRGKLLEESVALLKEGIPTVLGGLLEALQLGTGLITGLAQLG